MDWLESDTGSIPNSDVPKMIDVLKKLPTGWSMIETNNGYQIRDQDDEFVCEAKSPQRLNEIIDNEFELAQMYASMMYVLKSSQAAEA